jgi:hypothetical protein
MPEIELIDSCGAAVEGGAVIGKESMVAAERVAITFRFRMSS